jgi:hypothetical protein
MHELCKYVYYACKNVYECHVCTVYADKTDKTNEIGGKPTSQYVSNYSATLNKV